MSDYRVENSSRSRLHAAILAILFLGLVVALIGNVYQFVKTEHMSRELTLLQKSMQTQITRLSDATSGAFDVTQQRFQEVKQLQDSAASALASARSELSKSTTGAVADLEDKTNELDKKSKQLAAELVALRQEAASKFQKANSSLQATSAKLEVTSARLDRIAAATEANRTDLKQVSNDMASMRTSAATSAPRVTPPPAETAVVERNRVPFDLFTTRVPTRVGDVQIAIVNTDPRRNGYTMDVYAGDKIARDRNHMVNEAVQFYMTGHAQPYEIVVTDVRKDEVVGYLSEPMSTAAKLQPSVFRSSAESAAR